MSKAAYEQVFNLLSELSEISLRFFPKSFDRIESLAPLVNAYSELNESERESISDLITNDLSKALIGLSSMFCIVSLNDSNQLWLEPAMRCHLIEGFSLDGRENIRNLFCVEYVGYKLGVDMVEMAKSVSVGDEASQTLVGFFRNRYGKDALAIGHLKEKVVHGKIRLVSVD